MRADPSSIAQAVAQACAYAGVSPAGLQAQLEDIREGLHTSLARANASAEDRRVFDEIEHMLTRGALFFGEVHRAS